VKVEDVQSIPVPDEELRIRRADWLRATEIIALPEDSHTINPEHRRSSVRCEDNCVTDDRL
jgi:hypothetical protein